MISEWFLGIVASLWSFLGTLMPDWEMPEDIADPGGAIEQIVSMSTGLGIWFDWTGLAVIAAIPLAVWLIGFTWKVARTAFSHFPLIGGSG